MIIQQVYIGDNVNLYIIDYNVEQALLTFRVSDEPKYLRTAIAVENKDMIDVEEITFDQKFLLQFLEQNEL